MINNSMNKSKSPANDFFNDIDYASIIDTIKGIYTSDGSMSVLMDFERVLDEIDLYAFANWETGELVSGPLVKKYSVTCIFMWPEKLMPNPSGAKRLLNLGCSVKFKKTKLKVPIELKNEGDFKPGTHYPKIVEKDVWLVAIEMPKDIMNDIREGSIDLAGQTIDLEDLESAYTEDLDKEGTEDQEQTGQVQNPNMGMGAQMPGAQMPGTGGQPMGGMM
jgi:hypothetical protein